MIPGAKYGRNMLLIACVEDPETPVKTKRVREEEKSVCELQGSVYRIKILHMAIVLRLHPTLFQNDEDNY
jgi:hypothetical protein